MPDPAAEGRRTLVLLRLAPFALGDAPTKTAPRLLPQEGASLYVGSPSTGRPLPFLPRPDDVRMA